MELKGISLSKLKPNYKHFYKNALLVWSQLDKPDENQIHQVF